MRGAGASPKRRSARRRAARRLFAVAVLLALIALPLLARSSPYTLVLGIDVLIAVLFADQPAFHHGAGRHAFVRPRRLFRPGRLWRGACRSNGSPRRWVSRCCGAGRGRARRAAVRLVRGAPLRRLSRHADARLCPDRLVDRVPVAGRHRRLQRRARHLADAAVRSAYPPIIFLPLRSSSPGFAAAAHLFSPFGYAMRAGRDSPLRAEAIGIDVKRVHWLAFAIAGTAGGIAGGFSPSPRARSRRRRSASVARSMAS